MDEVLKHQVTDYVENTYSDELCNKCIGFMGSKTINIIDNLMGIYGRITEKILKEN